MKAVFLAQFFFLLSQNYGQKQYYKYRQRELTDEHLPRESPVMLALFNPSSLGKMLITNSNSNSKFYCH